ncbi:MAG TPA: hypothetical protein VEV84_11445 [Pyrinomonadaceae bacterium]|nr:hypothetical protein [Pyrinomonadaceae bacterium]
MDASIHDTFPTSTRLAEISAYLFRHPLRSMIFRWNWKAAVLSSLLRAPIFLAAYIIQKQGLADAIGVTIALGIFRILFGGVNGAIIQAYRNVKPAWHALLTVPVVLAAFSHLIEFAVLATYDAITGTQGKTKAILVSVIVSIISAVFNLFAMRRGALIVKDETMQSFWRDLIRMPWLIFEFISFPLVWTYKRQKQRVRNVRNS